MGYRWGRRRNEEIAKSLTSGDVANIRWPGHGPWSSLPPWERPGWQSGGGRGWCLYYLYQRLRSQQDND